MTYVLTPATLEQMRRTVAQAKCEVASGSIPDWWRQLSTGDRARYLKQHPHSHLKNMESQAVSSNLTPKQKIVVHKFLKGLTGPQGKLTKLADEKLNADNIPPKAQKQIADSIRAAWGDPDAVAATRAKNAAKSAAFKAANPPYKHTDSPSAQPDPATEAPKTPTPAEPAKPQAVSKPASAPEPTPSPVNTAPEAKPAKADGKKKRPTAEEEEANANGKKAIVTALASAGLLIAGATALSYAGVPLQCYTPDLVNNVWKEINPKDPDKALVNKVCERIKYRFKHGVLDEDAQNSLMAKPKAKGK